MKRLNISNILIVITLSVILFSETVFSQTNTNNNTFQKYYSVNLNGGTTLFWGDLRQYDYYPVMNNKNEWRVGYGMIINWQISPVFGLRGQLLNGKLSGANRELDKYFTADILTGNINTSIDFSNLFFKYNPNRFFSVYGILGVGLSNWRTEMKDLQNDNIIASNGTGNGRKVKRSDSCGKRSQISRINVLKTGTLPTQNGSPKTTAGNRFNSKICSVNRRNTRNIYLY